MEAEEEANVLANRFRVFLTPEELIINQFNYTDYNFISVLSVFFLLLIGGFGLFLSLQIGSFWWIVFLLSTIFLLYNLLRIKIQVMIVITSQRVLKIEESAYSLKAIQIFNYLSVTDLFFDSVGSLYYGNKPFDQIRFWLGLFTISLGYSILASTGINSVFTNISPLVPLGLLLTIVGLISLVYSIPIGRKVLSIAISSGPIFTFHLPKDHGEILKVINQLIKR